MTNNQPLTLQQAADYLNRKYETFRYYVTINRGPDWVLVGKRKCFYKEALDVWSPRDRRHDNGKNRDPLQPGHPPAKQKPTRRTECDFQLRALPGVGGEAG